MEEHLLEHGQDTWRERCIEKYLRTRVHRCERVAGEISYLQLPEPKKEITRADKICSSEARCVAQCVGKQLECEERCGFVMYFLCPGDMPFHVKKEIKGRRGKNCKQPNQTCENRNRAGAYGKL